MKDFKKNGGYPKKSFGARPSFNKRGPSAFGGRPSFDAPTEFFQATCNECHKKCEVPFRPNGKKPVYCRDCFKGKEEAPAYSRPNGFRKESAAPSGDISKQLDAISAKLDRLIRVLEK